MNRAGEGEETLSPGGPERTSPAGVDSRSRTSAVTADKGRITLDNSHKCGSSMAFPEPI